METLDRIKVFDGKKFGYLISFPKDKNKDNPKPPYHNLSGWGEVRIVETESTFDMYFRGNGATN